MNKLSSKETTLVISAHRSEQPKLLNNLPRILDGGRVSLQNRFINLFFFFFFGSWSYFQPSLTLQDNPFFYIFNNLSENNVWMLMKNIRRSGFNYVLFDIGWSLALGEVCALLLPTIVITQSSIILRALPLLLRVASICSSLKTNPWSHFSIIFELLFVCRIYCVSNLENSPDSAQTLVHFQSDFCWF